MDSQLAADIHASIHGLNRLLREAGVDEICKVLESVLQSPDQVTALHLAFNSRLKRLSRKGKLDTAFIERSEWFRKFSSKTGTRLAPGEIDSLSRITSCWDLSEEQIKTLAACSVVWSNNPELFWYGDTADEDIIRRCFNDLRRMEDVDPLRRRVVLMILAQHVEQVQDLLRKKGQRVRSRPRQTQSNGGHSRKRVLLPSAISSLTKDLWPGLQPEKRKSIRKRLTTDSLYGWKWRQLAHEEMALSLQDAATKKFERYSWSPIEVEAINRFIETLPQFKIQQRLHKAMSSIVSHYLENKNLNKSRIASTGGSLRAPSEAIATMTPESQSSAETPSYREPSEGYSTPAAPSTYMQPNHRPHFSNNQPNTGESDRRQWLLFDEGNAASIMPPPQNDPRLWNDLECSRARGFQSQSTEDSATEVDQTGQSQSQVPTPRAFESQPVLNPLPPFSESLVHYPIDWGQTYPLPQLANQAGGWHAPLLGGTPGIRIAQVDSLPQPVSNPLPPLGDIQDIPLSEWRSPTSPILLQDFPIIDSLSNPLPPFNSRSGASFFQ